jgi:alanine racemase
MCFNTVPPDEPDVFVAMPRPIRATISGSALRHNLARAREHAGGAKLWAVIKANAYGHGLLRSARALAAADGFAVLDYVDALRLRAEGDRHPILMLEGFFKPEDIPMAVRYALTPVVHNLEQIAMLEATPPESPLDVYLKVNSGMNRLGFVAENLKLAYGRLKAITGVRSITLMSHFADADGEGVDAQLSWFYELTRGHEEPRSLANSAALLRYPQSRADWVRPGIMLYGCSPFAAPGRMDLVERGEDAASLQLQPVMTLASELIAVQNLQPGERVGYGFAFEAKQEMTIGVIACGYADGYPRHAPSGTPVLVAGERTRTVGRVAMDMICVDISDIDAAYIGTPVTLWGEGLAADEVANAAGTVSYELLCALAPRVPISEVD